MKFLLYSIFIAIIILFSGCETSKIFDNDDYLTIGTFNIEWLGDGINDNKPRNEAEIQQIADIIQSSEMEIIAVQEVENDTALAKIVEKLDDYNFKLSKAKNKQKL